ncbi:MAG TPA: SCO family protein [Methylomirabilota bacterium]|nr:SCO family protein [Methylomirabilota bacterium]
MSRGRRAPLALLLTTLVIGAPALAHDAPPADEEFIKGVFTPSFVPPAPGSYDLPVVAKVAPVVVRDTAGRRVSTSAVMAGKVAVVSFIYTACSDRLGCPLASAALRELQSRLRDEGLAGDAVLVSISFDAERDTPGRLAKYASAFGADPALWRFLAAADARELDRLLRSYGQDRTPVYDERGRFTGRYRHVLKVFLVDRDGRIRNVYSTGFLVPQVVLNDIKTVLAP